MKIVSDIMVSDVLSVKASDSIHQARMLIKDKNIRHLPVLDDTNNHFIGLVSQRSLLNHAFLIVEKFGMSGLEKRELRTLVKDIMNAECATTTPDDSLLAVAKIFTEKKASCLPVIRDDQLVGIITSVDFVKLSLYFLEK